MSDAITSTKLEQTGGNILGQPILFECMDICVLSPAHECEMCSLVYLLIIKYLSRRFCLNSATVYYWTALSWNFGGFFLKTFLEGSVDHIIYRDYVANRRSLIYCSLARRRPTSRRRLRSLRILM